MRLDFAGYVDRVFSLELAWPPELELSATKVMIWYLYFHVSLPSSVLVEERMAVLKGEEGEDGEEY